MSELMQQVNTLLRIGHIRTSPYHSQTDGLAERFNGTLKTMIRRFAQEAPGEWDELLPYLLFSYREVPQASTGFSPFELLYGRSVRGPLDILREAWTEGVDDDMEVNVSDYVVQMRERLQAMSELVGQNMEQAQAKQKKYFDRNARDRSFEPGELVLLLLPTRSRKMDAAWQGPFRVIKRTGPVDYRIDMPGR